ncbi:DUF6119 family protein [Streptococcus sobrinus]|uniref:DUF6119 family protein n=1 Tax=Streptococcus sobrinus TaxID=1310 RepID=UPI000377001F|nr:DUF6119 family protein [Streptococcus sobrinus]
MLKVAKFKKFSIVLYNKDSFEACLKDEFEDSNYHEFDTEKFESIDEGRIYISETVENSVEWIDELNTYTSDSLKKDEYKNRSNKAVLMLKFSDKIFSFIYGYGRTMLKDSTIKKNFGLRTAINLISEESIKSVNTLNISSDFIDTQRQAFGSVK